MGALDVLTKILMVVVVLLVVFVVVWRCWVVTLVPMGVDTKPPTEVVARETGVVDEEMNGATVGMRVGEVREVALRGNATTGYAWRIVGVEGGSVVPEGKWQYKVSFPFLTGSGGYFQHRFRAVEPGQTDVHMTYDPVSEPQPGYSYFIRFVVG